MYWLTLKSRLGYLLIPLLFMISTPANSMDTIEDDPLALCDQALTQLASEYCTFNKFEEFYQQFPIYDQIGVDFDTAEDLALSLFCRQKGKAYDLLTQRFRSHEQCRTVAINFKTLHFPTILLATLAGDLNTVKFLWERIPSSRYSSFKCDVACTDGEDTRHHRLTIFDFAFAGGHLHILDYLLSQKKFWHYCKKPSEFIDTRRKAIYTFCFQLMKQNDPNNPRIVPCYRAFFETKQLCLTKGNITVLPTQISNLLFLQEIDFSHNKIKRIPNGFENLKNLIRLDLSHNDLDLFPSRLKGLRRLESLNLGSNKLKQISTSIKDLTKLKFLFINNNQLQNIPHTIWMLENLETFNVSNNQITTLPRNLERLKSLTILDLSFNPITRAPTLEHSLCTLSTLSISSLNSPQLNMNEARVFNGFAAKSFLFFFPHREQFLAIKLLLSDPLEFIEFPSDMTKLILTYWHYLLIHQFNSNLPPASGIFEKPESEG